MYMIFAEKLIGLAVVLAALTVGFAAIHHGELSLGILFLLGQVQSVLGHHRNGATHEASHIALHMRI